MGLNYSFKNIAARILGAATLSTAVTVVLSFNASSVVFAQQQQEQQCSGQQGTQTQQSSQSQQGSQEQSAQTAASGQGVPAATADAPTGQPEKKTKKVWTNDEVVSLRSDADNYQLEKEAHRAAAALVNAKEAAAAKEPAKEAPPPAIPLPETIEETQKAIRLKENQIEDEQSGLERLIRELPDIPEDQKERQQKEIDRVATDLPKVRNELKLLRDHLDKLTKAQTAPPAATPPSQ